MFCIYSNDINKCNFLLVQCNESRTDDAPSADVATSNQASVGKRVLDAGEVHTVPLGLLFCALL